MEIRITNQRVNRLTPSSVWWEQCHKAIRSVQLARIRVRLKRLSCLIRGEKGDGNGCRDDSWWNLYSDGVVECQ